MQGTNHELRDQTQPTARWCTTTYITGSLSASTDWISEVTEYRQCRADINGPNSAKLLKEESSKSFPSCHETDFNRPVAKHRRAFRNLF